MIIASDGFKDAMSGISRKYDIKLEITRNEVGASAIDISDRLISYSTSHDFESRSGRLNLEIDNYDYQLSPLNRDSSFNQKAGVYDPLFDSNHKIELFEGIIVGSEFEYVKKFEGYLGDEIQASSSPTISLSCRDKSKLMQDTYIYQSPSYALTLVEFVIQDLIDEFIPDSGIIVDVLTATQYMIGRADGPYAAKDTNLWDACQLLADSASQELRFLEDGSLIIRKIDRDFTGKPSQLSLNMSSLVSDDMSITDADVRNHIVIKVQGYDPITKEDEESIAKHGRRYMEVHRSMSDIITDVSQAHELGDNMLRDLRFANPRESSEIPLHPLIQVGDIVDITNPRLGTNAVNDIFKVTSVQNQYSKDKKRTRLELVGHDNFLSAPSIEPKPPTNLGYSIVLRTIQNYPNSGWLGYEKVSTFPMIMWTPPTKYVDESLLEDRFGGYIIERGTQYSRNGRIIKSAWAWEVIASIPSYIGALNKKVNYFYDYSASIIVDNYEILGYPGTTVSFKYRITAINKRGKKSTVTPEYLVQVPVPIIRDENGNSL